MLNVSDICKVMFINIITVQNQDVHFIVKCYALLPWTFLHRQSPKNDPLQTHSQNTYYLTRTQTRASNLSLTQQSEARLGKTLVSRT